MKKLNLIIPVVSVLMIMASCEQEGDPVPAHDPIDQVQARSDKAPSKTMVWSDGLIYESVVTPAVFDGDKGNYDKLYAANFSGDIGLISEAKPGDKDYNGGRWDMCVLKEGVDADKYSEATSDQELDPNDFMSTGNYFECPLLPRKQNN